MSENKFLISFCIPTYNRADYILETISSVVGQADSDIEIIVCDNASTDNTSEIVASAQKIFQNIKYFKWPENMGADLNYLKTVEMAGGEYCWFLGSDDLIADGAIKKIRKELISGCDIYLCSEYFSDKKARPYDTHYLLRRDIESSTFDLSLRNDRLRYFELAQSHSALFGYLSSIIFKREKWISIEYDDTFTGTLYSHMYMLYSFINRGCRLRYVRTPLVYWRSGNDSFGGPGKTKSRYMIDINGFKLIMNNFFKNDREVWSAFAGAFKRHHPLANIAHLRLNVKNRHEWIAIEEILVNDFEYSGKISLLRSEYLKPILTIYFLFQRVYRKICRVLAIVTMAASAPKVNLIK